jgi:hypothetical protein
MNGRGLILLLLLLLLLVMEVSEAVSRLVFVPVSAR